MSLAPPTLQENKPPPATTLVDAFGRRITYLRLSVTDRCDFRCTYCMGQDMVFLPHSAVMTLEECLQVAQTFVGLGVSKVRITGGEPLVRRNILWLIERLGALPGLENLVLTSNGSQLERFAAPLKAAGVKRLNISLDTLDPQRFRRITRLGDLGKVLRGIEAAAAAGFRRTKVNAVMMRGINDDEFCHLVQYAIDHALDISFIEEMPVGEIPGRHNTYIAAEETRQRLAARFTLRPTPENTGGPAHYWRIPGSDTRVGFIAPHSDNFCATCNRVRVTAKGELYPCLGHNDALQLLPTLRAHPGDGARLSQVLANAIGRKPHGHDFDQQRENPRVVRFMSMTGG